MKTNKTLLICIILSNFFITVYGCGDDDGGQPPAGVGITFVDPLKGDNITGDGSAKNPYKTITRAIQNSEKEIRLSHGVYDSASGEVFPIVLPTNVELTSEPINVANSSAALVRGAGEFNSKHVVSLQAVAIVLNESNLIRSLVVESPNGIAVWDEGDETNNRILRSAIQNSRIGVVSVNKSSISIEETTVQNNQDIGIQLLHESMSSFTNLKIINNGIGVVIQDDAKPSFGKKTGGGNNEITGNSNCDLHHLGNIDVNTVGTRWDQDVFDFIISNSCATGANIVNEGSGSINFQFIPSTTTPLFNARKRLALTLPDFGELFNTNQPNFTWVRNGSPFSMVAIWDEPPNVSGDGIENTSNMVWLWHSGLRTGINGSVDYLDGRSIQDGDINSVSVPIPLQGGRSYYWAAWEWNNDGTEINASSNVSYFRISN